MYGIHQNNFKEMIDQVIDTKPTQTTPLFTGLHTEHYQEHSGLLTKDYYEFLLNKRAPETLIYFTAGAQYIVPKHKILQHPLEFYIKLYSMLSKDRILKWADFPKHSIFDPQSLDAWTFERLMGYIFE